MDDFLTGASGLMFIGAMVLGLLVVAVFAVGKLPRK